ncbi:CapA family protein [Streptomyces sp. 8L]|uniref:CapA family protein n=1 Tax=Streptomyces sp. 8L TaxID=2877242 RepID=UPI001CD76125|nr:CapA family protein [Streptomyces sp. 8L]MCA1217885.1 CapA family protein [Streptomyces sp. 8L]
MGSTTFLATGDSILTRRLSPIKQDGFTGLTDLIRGADVAYTNVEMVFPGPGRMPATTYHGSHLGVDPELLDELPWMGFDVYGMANNHAVDYGTNGLAASIEEMRARRMPFAGVGKTLRDARKPVYVQTAGARVALISAGSSNSRLAAAADPGDGDVGRPGISPIRLQRTHFIRRDKFDAFRETVAEAGVDTHPKGTTAAGIFLPYPDRNMWDGPPPGGFAVEGVHFAPDDTSHIVTAALRRDIDALVEAVDEARRQADLVFVALHCHEGVDGRWNSDTPAEFLRPLAHALIDAGAHGVIGSGPHMLRGAELYRGRPICYSLGNFIFTLETTDSFPPEVYQQAGMAKESTASDFYDRITGYGEEKRFWQTVVPRFRFTDGELVSSELLPVTLGYGQSRGRRGLPVLADETDGREILDLVGELSKPFDTRVEVAQQDGRVVGRLVEGS